MNDTDQQTKRTAQDVELPAVARQRRGFSETWYFEKDGTIVATSGDNETEDAGWMLDYDLEDDEATVVENISADELPDFRTVAADGGVGDD